MRTDELIASPCSSSHRARRSCIAARAERQIASYAAWWTSGWTNSCSTPRGVRSRRRSSEPDGRRVPRSSSSGVSAPIASREKTRPTTAARDRTLRSPGSSASMRLARRASSVGGIGAPRSVGLRRMCGELLEEERHAVGGLEDRGRRHSLRAPLAPGGHRRGGGRRRRPGARAVSPSLPRPGAARGAPAGSRTRRAAGRPPPVSRTPRRRGTSAPPNARRRGRPRAPPKP